MAKEPGRPLRSPPASSPAPPGPRSQGEAAPAPAGSVATGDAAVGSCRPCPTRRRRATHPPPLSGAARIGAGRSRRPRSPPRARRAAAGDAGPPARAGWPRGADRAARRRSPVVLVAGLAAAGARRDRRARRRRRPRAARDRDARPRPPPRRADGRRPPRPRQPRRPSRRSRSATAPTASPSAAARCSSPTSSAGTLSVIDAETNEVVGEPIDAGDAPGRRSSPARASCGSRAPGSDAVQRFETAAASSSRPRRSPVGDRPEAISLGKQLVWVANRNDDTVNRIDRATPALVGARSASATEPDRHLRRPPLRVGDQLRRRHRHPDRPVDRAGRRRRRSPSATSRAA